MCFISFIPRSTKCCQRVLGGISVSNKFSYRLTLTSFTWNLKWWCLGNPDIFFVPWWFSPPIICLEVYLSLWKSETCSCVTIIYALKKRKSSENQHLQQQEVNFPGKLLLCQILSLSFLNINYINYLRNSLSC